MTKFGPIMVGVWVAIAFATLCDAVPSPSVESVARMLSDDEIKQEILIPMMTRIAEKNKAWAKFLVTGITDGYEDFTFDGTFGDDSFVIMEGLDDDVAEMKATTTEEERDLLVTELQETITVQQLRPLMDEAYANSCELDDEPEFCTDAAVMRKAWIDEPTAVPVAGRVKLPSSERPGPILPILGRIVVGYIVRKLFFQPHTAHAPDLDDVSMSYGDPHVIGFDGRKFLFKGNTKNTFTMLEAYGFTFTAKLSKNGDKTFYKQFEFEVAGNSIRVQMDQDERKVAVYRNGSLYREELVDETAAMKATTAKAAARAESLLAIDRMDSPAPVITVVAPGYKVEVKALTRAKTAHLDFSIWRSQDAPAGEVRGLLGDTIPRDQSSSSMKHPGDMSMDELVSRYAKRQ